ncbi:MAG TPA: alpha/beta hydrolase [Planctomycetaceae bacterium]|nr:alpha/beta hydrolase [Planctomycetaceae bacterium]
MSPFAKHPCGLNDSSTDTEMSPKRQAGWRKKLLIAVGLLLASLLLAGVAVSWWWFKPRYERIPNVEYGRRGDEPLLLDVFRPSRQNGAAVLVMISGSWKSSARSVRSFLYAPFLRRGYTVFAVRHISQPKCLIGDIVADIHRAVRFIRYHASDYGIDPDQIGVVGGSSGGHLALMLATRGGPGPADADDPIDRTSSAVQCVACFFPVTDLLNLEGSTEDPGDGGPPIHYKRGFGPRAETLAEWRVLGRELSPIYHIHPGMPPILIIHGDADTLVPLSQSTRFAERARAVGCEVSLEVRPGKPHGWPTMILDLPHMADWFDEHLRASASSCFVQSAARWLSRSTLTFWAASRSVADVRQGGPFVGAERSF